MATLSKSEAVELTRQLTSKTEQLAMLITKAHDEQVWVPLGYKSFTEWATKELPFTYARAFQLLNIGVLTEQLKQLMTLPDDYMLTDKQSRTISSNGRKLVLEAIAEEATDDPATNVSRIAKHLIALEASAKGDNEKTERSKMETEIKPISGGQRLTFVQNVHSVSAHLKEFPSPDTLDDRTREQGLTILLQAQATVQKGLDDVRDRNTKYQAYKGKNA